MSKVMTALTAARAAAWATLVPAFDTAIGLAKEAEYMAEKASLAYATDITPIYPPLILDLAHAGGYVRDDS